MKYHPFHLLQTCCRCFITVPCTLQTPDSGLQRLKFWNPTELRVCHGPGRDLRFLILSYGGNLGLTLACLAAQQRFFAPVTIFGVWGCACLPVH